MYMGEGIEAFAIMGAAMYCWEEDGAGAGA